MLSLDQARSLRGNNVQGPDGDSTFVTVCGEGKGLAFVPLDRLYAHYGLAGASARTDAGDNDARTARDTDRDGIVGYDTSGPTTDDAMTRSEEQLQVGTQKTEAGRARLCKYVTTETVQVPVAPPVRSCGPQARVRVVAPDCQSPPLP